MPTQAAGGRATPIQQLRFLLVEDHSFQRWHLKRLLADLGAVHVLEAADGPTGLKILRNVAEPIDIVISDLDMPGMDGMEFIRHVGEVGLPVSVILASALERSLIGSVETMARAYGVHLLGAVEKPATAASLEALIARHPPLNERSDRSRPQGKALPVAEIAEALAANQFHAVFQPMVELATRRVVGMEALARWQHPDRGNIPPYAFIKTMEDSGLIDELTWRMLAQSSSACAAWRAAGFDLGISVNLSWRSLTDLALGDRVRDIVIASGLTPQQVMLEVTESAATTDVGKALENLSRLRMKGFGLAIDDYGTGYASMQQLTRIAFSELKIDQSFVRNVPREGPGRVILETSLEMARKLSLVSVAEGVESERDWEFLRELGCDMAQGYYIAKPMEAAAVADWLSDWAKRA